MNGLIRITALTLSLVVAGQVSGATPLDRFLEEYRRQGAATFSAVRGEQLWLTEFSGRSCSSCHTRDPRAVGRHQKTRKTIDPLAPSATSTRLTKDKTIRKWLKRNCKWTLRRECTPQEKGDFLTWLSQQ